MNRIASAVAILLILAGSNRASAQVTWTTGYPKSNAARTFTVQGKIVPPVGTGWTPGDVTIDVWSTKGDSSTLQKGLTIKAKDLTKNKDGSWTFGPADTTVTVGMAEYNITATVPYLDSMGTQQEKERTQPVKKTAN